jgi:ClpP class serine protease
MWLLEQNVFSDMRESYNKKIEIDAEVKSKFEAFTLNAESETSRLLKRSEDGVASIGIQGVISNKPNILAMLFGGGNVLWAEIVSALDEAEASASIKEVILDIDSPGGSVDGMFDALAAVQAVNKPVKAVVSNVCASAAFGLASQANEIIAKNKAVRVGSVGVVGTFSKEDDVVRITSTEAPNKAPDVTTKEGVEVVREELDALHELFVESIADGRSRATGTSFSVEKVNENFGQGAVFLAEKALSRGMIDSILEKPVLRSEQLTDTISAQEPSYITMGNDMDLKTLKKEHSDLYEAAHEEGIQAERDRVVAHLTMADASGAFETALKAIKDGSGMTATLNAEYSAAALKKSEVNARHEDEAYSSEAVDNAVKKTPEASVADTVASLVEQQLGVA